MYTRKPHWQTGKYKFKKGFNFFHPSDRQTLTTAPGVGIQVSLWLDACMVQKPWRAPVKSAKTENVQTQHPTSSSVPRKGCSQQNRDKESTKCWWSLEMENVRTEEYMLHCVRGQELSESAWLCCKDTRARQDAASGKLSTQWTPSKHPHGFHACPRNRCTKLWGRGRWDIGLW